MTDESRTTVASVVCPHGSLLRQCRMCKLEAEVAALRGLDDGNQLSIAQLKAQLAEFVASFDAAIFEGLLNKLSELHPHETGSIGDLVTRRLLYTYEKYLADAARAK